MRNLILIVAIAALMVGCAKSNPVSPATYDDQTPLAQNNGSIQDGPYRLWSEWMIFFPKDGGTPQLVPRRESRFHLNALKLLEQNGKNCVQITGKKNNGDGTIDLTVLIKHPFPGYLEYTGFDVKGIIMFNGSYAIDWDYLHKYDLQEPTRLSWREMGDPEIVNPDGYTPRWAPGYDSGSDLPIFKYWNGKFSNGLPNSNLNAFLNFYTNEERHMFSCTGQVSRTYTIWLPPGQDVIAGYAVEACWEPPTVMPVNNPLTDFPFTANQPEPYLWKVVVNNGEPIMDCEHFHDLNCDGIYAEFAQWYEPLSKDVTWRDNMNIAGTGSSNWMECNPPDEIKKRPLDFLCSWEGQKGDGIYREICIVYKTNGFDKPYIDNAYSVFDYELDLED
ncbi:MAG: hypothetical protein ABIC40_07870 [bacterium]